MTIQYRIIETTNNITIKYIDISKVETYNFSVCSIPPSQVHKCTS